jgi:K+/H+ antiporter YhaU regulatory subunit KhtT
LREAPIRAETNVLVVAIRGADGKFVYNPPADYRIESGSFIVVLGTADGVRRLRQMICGASRSVTAVPKCATC